MENNVFISYRRADSAGFAGRIYDRLNALFPNHIFMDVANIKPGVDFFQEISKSIASCAVVIVLIGKTWFRNGENTLRLGDAEDLVTFEIKTALDLNILVIPVLLDGTPMPAKADLPPQLTRLFQHNAVEINHAQFVGDIEPLVDTVYRSLGLKPPTPLERFLESLMESVPFAPIRYKYDEKMRDWHAIVSVCFGLLLVLMAGFQMAMRYSDLEALFLPLGGAFAGVIGMNSKKRRRLALIGLCLAGIAFVVQLALLEYHGAGGPANLR